MPVKIIAAGEHVVVPSPQAVPAPAVAAPTPSASETLIQSAVATGAYRAPGGQTYAFRRLGPLDRMLLSKALGGELMLNGVYASYAFVAASVIREHHAAAGYAIDTASAAFKDTWTGIQRAQGRPANKKAPLVTADLRRAVEALPATLTGKRDRTILLIGFAAALRRSELALLEVSARDGAS